MEQTVTEFPWDITPEYLAKVNPTGYFRFWNKHMDGGGDTHQFSATVDLMSGGAAVSTVGRILGDITTDEIVKTFMNEEFWLLPPVDTLNIDAIR